MARTKGTIKTPANIEPEVGSPLDARQKVATKADLTANGSFPYPWVGMSVYCAEDGKTYQLTNVDVSDINNWKVLPGEDTVEKANEAYSIAQNHSAFIENMFSLNRRLGELELAAQDIIERAYTPVAFDSAVFKQDVLPIHESYHFCRTFEFLYTGDFQGTQSPETIKVNNKDIGLVEAIGSNAGSEDIHTVKVIAAIDSISQRIIISVYDGATLKESVEITDSIILTFELTSNAASLTADSFTVGLHKMKYQDVDLDYPYPVLECRDGTVVYRAQAPNQTADNNLGFNFDILACYTLGNKTKICDHCLNQGTKKTTQKGCEYIYMANWYWVKDCTKFNSCLVPNELSADYEVYGNPVKQLDFSKLHFDKITKAGQIIKYYEGASLADGDIFKMFNFDLQDLEIQIQAINCEYVTTNLLQYDLSKVKQLSFARCCKVKTLGDLTELDLSNVKSFTFTNCYLLDYIGDPSKWNVSSLTSLNNMFKADFNIKLNDGIKNWRFPNATGIAWLFESCMYVGDSVLHGLGEWETGNITDMRGTFSYDYETSGFDPVTGYIKKYYRKNHWEWPEIVDKRTDLSFVEDWDVSSVTKFRAFFANNPYLTDVGQLSNWEINPSLTTGTDGITDFLLNCTALENLDMPSIPRGVDVTGFVAGCMSLANVTLDELNVAAISFADCPLTKQSVLNLINAATDDVEITLKADVYTAVASDSDVTAAISAKAASSITVQLVSAA